VRQIVASFDQEPRRVTLNSRYETYKNRLLFLAEQYKETKQILSTQNVATELGISLHLSRKLFHDLGLHIEFPHRFTTKQIYQAAMKVKHGESIAKVVKGDKYLANLVGDYCRTHNIPLRHSKWQDLTPRKTLVAKLRKQGKPWSEIALAVSKMERIARSGPAIYQWSKTNIPELFKVNNDD
jgi:hypothetical protein